MNHRWHKWRMPAFIFMVVAYANNKFKCFVWLMGIAVIHTRCELNSNINVQLWMQSGYNERSDATIKCDYDEIHSKFLWNRLHIRDALALAVSISLTPIFLMLPGSRCITWILNITHFMKFDGITSWISSLQLHLSLFRFHYISLRCVGVRSTECPVPTVGIHCQNKVHISFVKSFVFARIIRIQCGPGPAAAAITNDFICVCSRAHGTIIKPFCYSPVP